MRTAFIQQLLAEARRNPRLFLVVGDLGFSVVEPFAAEFPDRYLNAGVAEQNMTGVAAGLASEGYHPFTYSIANFPTLRCLEQIRNDICYHQLPVTVVSVGGGMAYGPLGYSHHALQDLGIMTALPHMTVLAPADPGETRQCVRWLSDHPGPSYLRLGKAGEPVVHSLEPVGRVPLCLRAGSGPCAIVGTGAAVRNGLAAAEKLAAEGLSVAAFSMPWLKPLEAADLSCLLPYKHIVSVEDHASPGALASVLRSLLPSRIAVTALCVPDALAAMVGSEKHLRSLAGVDEQAIGQAVKALF